MKQLCLLVLMLCTFGITEAQHDMKNIAGMKSPANSSQGIESSMVVSDTSRKNTGFLQGKLVQYDLYVNDTMVSFAGKKVHAIAINGQIPGPTIELTQGDTAVIRVHNLMNVTTSIHWHGILIPNQYDGVPGLTTFPIQPGKTLKVVFPVRQNGTYWYHSHTMTQEQIGLTGSIVIHKRDEPRMKEQVIVLNDWTNTKPAEVFRVLTRQSDWFAIKKKSVQSYGHALVAGHLGDKIKQEWMRMPAMDVSDVWYNRFLVNGQPTFENTSYQPGDSIRLRIINASSSSYFWVQYAGGKMEVVSADGQDVKPVDVDKFLIATAETYDVIIHIPSPGKFELRATAQDISNYTSAYFGEGKTVAAPTIPKLDYFKIMHHMNKMMSSMHMEMGATENPMTNVEVKNANAGNIHHMDMAEINMNADTSMKGMDMSKDTSMKEMAMDNDTSMSHHMEMNNMGNMTGMQMSGMQMASMKMYGFDYPPGNKDDVVLSYKMLRAANNDPAIPRPEGQLDRIIRLVATGNMFRYVWSFNNTILTNADKILIKKGEHVRVIFQNNTMMEHPLHLHGHFFRLSNAGSLDNEPLKHTFNLLPMATDTIDFAADEEKDWFFHCHTLYHMLSGMARVFHYQNTLPEVQKESPGDYKRFLKEHGQHVFFWGASSFQSQGNFTNFTVAGTKWEGNEEFKWNYKKLFESETRLRRFVDRRQFLAVFLGADNRREKTNEIKDGLEEISDENVATAGLTYFLPLLITAEARIDQTGHLRFQLQREDLAVTRRTRFSFSWNTDKEYELGLKYIITRNLGLTGSYDSNYGWGAGISFIY
ncbi:MAG: multicopper oxidase domain-containing protein [Ginsengibacter sp.]